MFTITPHWYPIKDTYLLTDNQQDGTINLMLTKGDAMRYDLSKNKVVDFPGEYDIEGYGIVCFDAGDSLHYQLIIEDEVVVIIQDPALLEKESLGDVDTRLCTSEACKEAIERDELEGNIIIMDN